MSILPTAHASQRFGGKTIDFYVAPGQVIGSDPRARADERRIQDLDGERHPVRFGARDFSLEPGDYAAVIRLQPGPKRRSRPVAVVNYRTNSWTRTHGDAPGLLSRAGVARNMNWLLTMAALLAVCALIVWPQLVAMLSIFAPGIAAGLPVFDIFAAIAAVQPGLAEARLAGIMPGLSDVLVSAVPQLAGHEGAAIFGIGVAAGAVLAFGARSWRFVWVPVFLVGILCGAIAIAGQEAAMLPALIALGASALFFMAGGFINRWRDSVRLEARVARLADHVLRHPPGEMVTRKDTAPALTDETTEDAVEAVSDGAQSEAATEGDAGRAAAAGVAAIGAAAISARSIDTPQDGDTAEATPAETEEEVQRGSSDQDDSEAQADSPNATDASVQDAIATDAGAESEAETAAKADASPDAPAGTGEAETASLEGSDEEAVSAQTDPRHEARSMDIPPPPPMPSPMTASDAPSDIDEADAASPAAADDTLEPETGDAPRPQELAAQTDAGPVEQAGDTLQDDEDGASTPDVFGGGEEKRD